MANPDELLSDAATRGPGDHVERSVQDLLACWGYRVRDFDSVPHIEGELNAAGLVTEPPFADAPSDAVIRLVPVGVTTFAAPEPEEEAEEAEEDVEELRFPQASLLVRDIPSASAGVVTASPEDSLDDARSKMMMNDCDHVVVLGPPGDLRGAVTWASIATASVPNPDPTLREATKDVETVRLDADLLTQLPKIYETGFALVRDQNNQICGVVTTADLSRHYEHLVRPFFLIGEIERRLRHRINERFSPDDLQGAFPKKKVTSADHLMFGQYVQLLTDSERWQQMNWHCARTVFVSRLNEVREIRNSVMHFDADPLTDGELTTLENFAKFLRDLDPRP